jgi:ribosomal-protein-alanine N-acetyltransferase
MCDHISIARLGPEQFEMAAGWLARPEINRWLYSEWRGRAVDEKLVAVVAMNARNALFSVNCGHQAAGLVALGELNRTDGAASVWYLLGSNRLGRRGVISEGLRLLCEVAASEFRLHTLHASVIEGNRGSVRVLEKCGFQYAGRLREAFKLDDGFADRLLYDRLIECA